MPVIAAIQRACMGGGLELALCCDVRLAAEGTLFSIPEVQLGLVPDMGGTQRLPRTVGIGKAKELIYSARRIDAAEALRIGLVNAVYPAGELCARVAELAGEIAANAPLAVQAAKRAIDGTYCARARARGSPGRRSRPRARCSPRTARPGMRAAAERQRANFKGTIGPGGIRWQTSTTSVTSRRSAKSRSGCTRSPSARTASASRATRGSARCCPRRPSAPTRCWST